MIYVDNASTTKMNQAAVDAMLSCLQEDYGNPSSLHSMGQKAAALISKARADISNCIGVAPKEIYFTSGGTESDNQALLTGAEYGRRNNKFHIISQKTEHHAVLHTLAKLEKQGFEITLLDVDSEGNITPEQVKNAIRDDTALVTIMYANNELGTIFPIKGIAEVCREKGVLFHTDAVQAVGHIPIDLRDIRCDMLSFSAHKFGGAKGTGALFVRNGLCPARVIEGGSQERGYRPGTENVPGICAMAAALKYSTSKILENMKKIAEMRDQLIKGLSAIPQSVLNGSTNHRLPGNVSMCFEGIEGESLLLLLDAKGICASAGSACASGSLKPSHVLTAIGRDENLAHGAIRFSLSAENTPAEIEYVIKSVTDSVNTLRATLKGTAR